MQIIDKEANGLAVLMTVMSLQVTPLAALSRPVCGIRSSTIIATLPGSAKASQECLQFLAPVLPHAVDLLCGRETKVKNTHSQLQSEGPKLFNDLSHIAIKLESQSKSSGTSNDCSSNNNNQHQSGHSCNHSRHNHHNFYKKNKRNNNKKYHGCNRQSTNTAAETEEIVSASSNNDDEAINKSSYQANIENPISGNTPDSSTFKHNTISTSAGDYSNDATTVALTTEESVTSSDNSLAQNIVRSSVCSRPRKSPYPMIPVEQAQSIIFSEAFTKPSITKQLIDCLGYVLASDITSSVNIPPFPASIKDGYAVLASDGSGRRKVVGGVYAGQRTGEATAVTSGQCARINTGAPMPPGTDAVIQVKLSCRTIVLF